MKDSMNYLIPLLMLIIGVILGMNKFEPVYEVTEIVLTNPPDTIRMGFSACLDMTGGA